ncbi:hypothetical protein F1880_002040 [Penicillium rolfsii]|nr:hypothetical protein F1880_002040 [Penicillium rolfsii]
MGMEERGTSQKNTSYELPEPGRQKTDKPRILQDLIPSRGGGGKCEDEAIAAQSHLSQMGLALPEARESEAVTAQRVKR